MSTCAYVYSQLAEIHTHPKTKQSKTKQKKKKLCSLLTVSISSLNGAHCNLRCAPLGANEQTPA